MTDNIIGNYYIQNPGYDILIYFFWNEMSTYYKLKFKVTELSETDFAFLANSGNGIYGNLLNNKVELYHSNHINVDSGLTHRQRMINWLRKNANGLWYFDPLDKPIIFDNLISNNTDHTSVTYIYFELKDDIISFKMRWNE